MKEELLEKKKKQQQKGSELAPLTIPKIEEKEIPKKKRKSKTKKKIITKKEETKTPTESKKYIYDFGGGSDKEVKDKTKEQKVSDIMQKYFSK